MDGKARILKLVWSAPHPDSEINPDLEQRFFAKLVSLSVSDPGEARRLARRFIRDVDRIPRLLPPPPQLSLFPQPGRPGTVASVKTVVPLGASFILDDRGESCPRCRNPLTQRSRIGTRVYYTCSTEGCPNHNGIFIALLGTGDD